jgi:hypothetical protein
MIDVAMNFVKFILKGKEKYDWTSNIPINGFGNLPNVYTIEYTIKSLMFSSPPGCTPPRCFFKALFFLSVSPVIHAMSNEQDMICLLKFKPSGNEGT